MSLKVDEATLQKIFRCLWKEFKVSADHKKFVIFPVDKIEVLVGGAVSFERREGANNLREGLRQLGVTMYHLATGHSERNKASLAIDGYPEIATELWPVIALMLSGQAFSIPQIDEMASYKTQMRNRLARNKDSLKKIFGALFVKTGRVSNRLVGAGSRCLDFLKRCYPMIKNVGATVMACVCLLEVIAVTAFNVAFSSLVGSAVFALIFVLSLIVIYGATFGDISTNDERQRRRMMHVWFFPMLFFSMAAYAGTTFIFFSSGVGNMENGVILERGTNKFVGRLANNSNDNYLLWNKNFINHFRYKVTYGIPVNDVMERKYDIASGNVKLNRVFQVRYAVIDGRYSELLEKYGTKESLEKEIEKHFNDKVVPAVRKDFDDYMAEMSALSSKKLTVSITGALVDEYGRYDKGMIEKTSEAFEEDVRKKIDQEKFSEFLRKANQEIKRVKIDGVRMSLQLVSEPPKEATVQK